MPRIPQAYPHPKDWKVEGDLDVRGTTDLHGNKLNNVLPPIISSDIIVASSTSKWKDVINPDYVCDGVDDQATIQNAIDNLSPGAHLTLLDGTYNLDVAGTLHNRKYGVHINTDDIKISLSPKTIIKDDSSGGDLTLFLVEGNKFQLNGNLGKIKGQYLQGDGQTIGSRGIYILASDKNLTDIRIENLIISNLADRGIIFYIENQKNLKDVYLSNLKFTDSYCHLMIRNGDAQNGSIIDNVDVIEAKFEYAEENHIHTSGPIHNISYEGLYCENAGGMDLEMFISSSDRTAGYRNKNISIVRSYFGPASVRTISVAGLGVTIEDNKIKGDPTSTTNYLETRGKYITLKNNKIYYSRLSPDPAEQEYFNIEGNTFYNPTSGDASAVGLELINSAHYTFKNNKIIFDFDSSTTYRAGAVELRRLFDAHIVSNFFYFNNIDFDQSSIWMQELQDVDFKENTFLFESNCTFSSGWQPIWLIQGLVNCNIEKNTLKSKKYSTVDLMHLRSNVTTIKKETEDAGSWTEELVTDGPLNSPPGDETPGDIYLVGDDPTGDFAGHRREFAEWDGSVWSFTSIDGWAVDLGRNYTRSTLPNASSVGTGDVYALLDEAIINTVIKDLNFSLWGNLAGKVFLSNQTNAIHINNDFINNDKLEDYTTKSPRLVIAGKRPRQNNRSVSSSTDALPSDQIVEIDTNGGNRTLTMMDASDVENREFIIKNTGSSANTLTIDDISGSSITTVSDGNTARIISNGSQWIVT